MEFFTRRKVVDKLLEVLVEDYPSVSYHVVDHKVRNLLIITTIKNFIIIFYSMVSLERLLRFRKIIRACYSTCLSEGMFTMVNVRDELSPLELMII